MFKKVCIVGFGLIGSSIAHNLKNKNLCTDIICLDKSQTVCNRVMELGLASHASEIASEVIPNCDIIILCVPVGAIGNVCKEIAPYIKQGAIVTDVGSTKCNVIQEAVNNLPQHVHFVAAHPLAGTEFSGPDAGFESLFESRWSILTPNSNTNNEALDKVAQMWKNFGAVTAVMAAENHDRILAMTSHLPQLLSYIIVQTASKLEKDMGQDVINYSANGFHGFARIAASDPVMWRDIFNGNKEAVLSSLDRFTEEITFVRNYIESGESGEMEDYFAHSRNIHLAHLKSKQL